MYWTTNIFGHTPLDECVTSHFISCDNQSCLCTIKSPEISLMKTLINSRLTCYTWILNNTHSCLRAAALESFWSTSNVDYCIIIHLYSSPSPPTPQFSYFLSVSRSLSKVSKRKFFLATVALCMLRGECWVSVLIRVQHRPALYVNTYETTSNVNWLHINKTWKKLNTQWKLRTFY